MNKEVGREVDDCTVGSIWWPCGDWEMIITGQDYQVIMLMKMGTLERLPIPINNWGLER